MGCRYKKLNIDVVLPNNQSKENLYAFGHGPYNGVVTIESPNKVNFKVNNVKNGQYVAARVVFDKSNIKNSAKLSNKDMLFKIMQEEEGIYKNNEKKQRFTIKVLLLAIALFIYWVILIFVYEKDKKYVTAYTGEDELLKNIIH